jgi:hypothetical protein
MNVDPVAQGMQKVLLEQVAKSLLDTTADKDNPFAALLATALGDGAGK